MSDAVLTERARIQAEIEGRTLVDALADTVAARGDEPAYSDKHHVPEGESWRTLDLDARRASWRSTSPAGLIEAGSSAGDTVAIMATNRIEHFVADIGAVHAAATPMSIYNTLSHEQVAYVAGAGAARRWSSSRPPTTVARWAARWSRSATASAGSW